MEHNYFCDRNGKPISIEEVNSYLSEMEEVYQKHRALRPRRRRREPKNSITDQQPFEQWKKEYEASIKQPDP